MSEIIEEQHEGESSSETPTPASAYSTASTSPHLLPRSVVDDLEKLDDINLPSDFDEDPYAPRLPSSPLGSVEVEDDVPITPAKRPFEEDSFPYEVEGLRSAPLDDDNVTSQVTGTDSDVDRSEVQQDTHNAFLVPPGSLELTKDKVSDDTVFPNYGNSQNLQQKEPILNPATPPSKPAYNSAVGANVSGGERPNATPSWRHKKDTDFTQIPKRARIDHYFKPASKTPSFTESVIEELEGTALPKPSPKVFEVPDDLIDLTNDEIVAYDEQYAKRLAEQERQEIENERKRNSALMRNDEEYARRLQFAKDLQNTFRDDDDIQFVGIKEGSTPLSSAARNVRANSSRPVLPTHRKDIPMSSTANLQNNVPSSSSLTIVPSSSPSAGQRNPWLKSYNTANNNSIPLVHEQKTATEPLPDKKALHIEMRKTLEKCCQLNKDIKDLLTVDEAYSRELDDLNKRSSDLDHSSSDYWQSISATNILKSNIGNIKRDIEIKQYQLKEQRRLVSNYTMALSANNTGNSSQPANQWVPKVDPDVVAIGERPIGNHYEIEDAFNELDTSDYGSERYYSDDGMEDYDSYNRRAAQMGHGSGILMDYLNGMVSKGNAYYQNLLQARTGQAPPPTSSYRDSTWSTGYAGSSHYDAYTRRTKEQEAADLAKLLDNINPDEEKPESRIGTPDELIINLMEHQKIGLKWLQAMESNTKGGLLADDMGLGKTIQIIALLVSRASTDDECKTTLIVTPVSLCRQWAREIEVKIKKQFQLSVYVYHGQARRNMTFNDLSKYDVVLTSYGVLSRDFKEHKALAITNTGSSKKKDPESVFFSHEWYRIVLDEAQYIKNRDTLSSKACSELKSELRWCLSGTPMQNNVEELYSLVRFLRIRPYDEFKNFTRDISNPVKSRSEKARQSGINKVQAILKTMLLRRTKASKIDGKPILILPPKTSEMVNCLFSEEERTFYKALEHGAAVQFNKFMAQGTDFHNVLVLLLRLRQACCHPRLIQQTTIKNAMDAAGAESRGAENLARTFKDVVVARIKEKEAFECPVCWDAIEDQNIRLIFPCGHECCAECIGRLAEQHQQYGIQSGYDNSENGLRCPTCRGPLDPRNLVTWAAFQKTYGPTIATKEENDLLEEAIEGSQGAASKLGIKGESLSEKAKGKMVAKDENEMIDQDHSELLNKVGKEKGGLVGEEYIGSAKVNKCLELIKKIMNEHPGEKTLVFSSFTSLLDIIGVPLDDEGIQYVRYDGSMSAGARNDAIFSFQDKPDLQVMLISLKAGNVGLNLTSANHCILLDPFWNPYVEDQAVDRVHRIGQTRPVTVHRLLVPDTVEDRILKLQKEKREMIEAALDEEGMRKISRLGRRELAFLLGINREV